MQFSRSQIIHLLKIPNHLPDIQLIPLLECMYFGTSDFIDFLIFCIDWRLLCDWQNCAIPTQRDYFRKVHKANLTAGDRWKPKFKWNETMMLIGQNPGTQIHVHDLQSMLCHKRLLNNSKTCVNLTQIEDWRFWRSPVYYTSVCKQPRWKRFVKIILSTWCIPTKSIFSCNIQSNPCLRKKEKLILDKSQTFLKAIPRRVDMHTRQMCIKWIFCPHSTFSETVLRFSTKEGGTFLQESFLRIFVVLSLWIAKKGTQWRKVR